MRMRHVNRREVSGRVKNILSDFPEARNSDAKLFLTYIVRYHNASPLISFEKAMLDESFPNYGTVERVRRKIQRLNPELRADADVEAAREIKEEEFREYARARE